MEMLAHSHYESMFSSTALVYRRSHMCRFECNVRMCAKELLPQDSPHDIQVAHSVVWLSCRSFRIIAVLVISGKQPSSELLQLYGLYLCVLSKLSTTVVLFNIFSTYRKQFVFQAILSHRAITSTNADSTASQTTVPGYHTLSMTGYEDSCV